MAWTVFFSCRFCAHLISSHFEQKPTTVPFQILQYFFGALLTAKTIAAVPCHF